MSEEINNQEQPVIESAPVMSAAPVLSEPVVEAVVIPEPVVETKVEEVAADLNITASVSEEVSPASENVITAPSYVRSEPRQPRLGVVGNGAIGSVSEPANTPKVSAKGLGSEMVHLWSDRNLRVAGYGRLQTGLNLVKKKHEDRWLAISGVRKATQEEIANSGR
jgi:hypothetical protein